MQNLSDTYVLKNIALHREIGKLTGVINKLQQRYSTVVPYGKFTDIYDIWVKVDILPNNPQYNKTDNLVWKVPLTESVCAGLDEDKTNLEKQTFLNYVRYEAGIPFYGHEEHAQHTLYVLRKVPKTLPDTFQKYLDSLPKSVSADKFTVSMLYNAYVTE
jgi:hypothetical protein